MKINISENKAIIEIDPNSDEEFNISVNGNVIDVSATGIMENDIIPGDLNYDIIYNVNVVDEEALAEELENVADEGALAEELENLDNDNDLIENLQSEFDDNETLEITKALTGVSLEDAMRSLQYE